MSPALHVYSYEIDLHQAHAFARELPDCAHLAANILNVEVWGDRDDEELHETDLDEAIANRLDSMSGGPSDKRPVLEQLPKTITVVGYRRRTLEDLDGDADRLCEHVIEDLDGEYGGGDDPTDITQAMIEAASVFLEVVRREYRVWQCEPVHEVLVDVSEWVAREHPEWLAPMIEEADLEA